MVRPVAARNAAPPGTPLRSPRRGRPGNVDAGDGDVGAQPDRLVRGQVAPGGPKEGRPVALFGFGERLHEAVGIRAVQPRHHAVERLADPQLGPVGRPQRGCLDPPHQRVVRLRRIAAAVEGARLVAPTQVKDVVERPLEAPRLVGVAIGLVGSRVHRGIEHGRAEAIREEAGIPVPKVGSVRDPVVGDLVLAQRRANRVHVAGRVVRREVREERGVGCLALARDRGVDLPGLVDLLLGRRASGRGPGPARSSRCPGSSRGCWSRCRGGPSR